VVPAGAVGGRVSHGWPLVWRNAFLQNLGEGLARGEMQRKKISTTMARQIDGGSGSYREGGDSRTPASALCARKIYPSVKIWRGDPPVLKKPGSARVKKFEGLNWEQNLA